MSEQREELGFMGAGWGPCLYGMFMEAANSCSIKGCCGRVGFSKEENCLTILSPSFL